MSSLTLLVGMSPEACEASLFTRARTASLLRTVLVLDADRGREALRLLLDPTSENLVPLGPSSGHDLDLAGSWLTSRLYSGVLVAINRAEWFKLHGDRVTVERLYQFARNYNVEVLATFRFGGENAGVTFVVERVG